MNKIYKIKWSQTTHSWVVCSELSSTKVKSSMGGDNWPHYQQSNLS
ncbi:ESPR domain-containing protein [Gallibacterium melopsittaci]|uniref:ESPR domain-containing protein n=1 Tax=Gallibacterium melopsittaci TaxID=516063 RepID=A0ABV6HTT2_9PAST